MLGSGKMEKPKPKPKKKTTIQITYPAPYSQSWTPDVQPVLMKNKVGVSASLFHRSKRPAVSPRAWSQQFPAGRPDPTAPHLKYGVFRNRRGAPAKPFPKIDTFQKMDRFKRVPSPPKQIKPIPGQVKVPRGLSKSSSINAPMKPAGKVSVQSEFPPKLVPGKTDSSYSKELCLSKVSHLDIKPKSVSSASPSFCPTPNFKSIPRRVTHTPTKFRSNEHV